METQLNRHDDMLSMHEIRLADMDLRFQVLETASYNGTLIWKIRDYKRRKQEAVAAKTLSLYSQPFYTGYFGYKVSLTSDTSNTAGNKTDSELWCNKQRRWCSTTDTLKNLQHWFFRSRTFTDSKAAGPSAAGHPL